MNIPGEDLKETELTEEFPQQPTKVLLSADCLAADYGRLAATYAPSGIDNPEMHNHYLQLAQSLRQGTPEEREALARRLKQNDRL